MKKLLYTLSLALLGTLAHAQVKIGSNPGTIGSSSNLEIEASNGNKTSINKSTGQVTIADGTQGAGRIFTSDANGNGSWTQTVVTGGTVRCNVPQSFTNAVSTTLITPAPITTSNPGTYSVSLRWWGVTNQVLTSSGTVAYRSSANPIGSTSAYIQLVKNGTVVMDEIEYYATGVYPTAGGIYDNAGFSFTVSLLSTPLVAGDVISIRIAPSLGGGAWITGLAGNDYKFMPSLVITKL